MRFRDEFLILDRPDGTLGVYSVERKPAGTPIDRGARKLRVVGPVLVRPPRETLTAEQFEKWVGIVRDAGFQAEIEPFWTHPAPTADGPSVPLHEAFDELLRLAEGRS